MKTLKQLTENEYGCVYVICKTDEENEQFKRQAEDEGFLGVDGHTKPTELPNCKHYGLNNDMTMGYVFGIAWHHIVQGKTGHKPVIDYGKYVAGEENYIYKTPDK